MGRRAGSFFRILVRRRGRVLAAYAVLLAAAAGGLTRLRVDYSAEQFFLFGGADRARFEAYKGYFPREDLQVSAFLEAPDGLDLADFRILQEMAAAFEEVGLRSIRWLGGTEFVQETVVDGEEAVAFVRPMDEPELDEGLLQTLTRSRRDHPLYTGVLWNRDLTVFAVHGFLDPGDNHDARRREVTAGLRARLEEMDAGGRPVVLNGLPVLRVTVPLALERDLTTLLGLGVLLALSVVWLHFRRATLALLCLAGIVPAVALVLGILGWLGRPVTVLTSSMPIVVLVVGISDAIHLLVATRRRHGGRGPVDEAVVEAFASLARACLFTSLTTAFGFLGLVATGIPLIVDFGVVTAAAVMTTWAVSLTLLPALLSFARDLGPTDTALARACRWISERARTFLRVRPGPVAAVFAALLAGGVALGAGLQVRTFLIDDFKPGDPLLEELRWLEREGYGVFQVNVFVEHGDVPGHDPEALAWAAELERFALQDPLILGAVALPDFVREMGIVAGLDPAAGEARGLARFPASGGWSAATVGELLFLAELQGEDAVEEVYRAADGVSQVVLFIRDGGSPAITASLERLEARLREVPPPAGEAWVTGTVKLSQLFWDRMMRRMLPGVALAVLLVLASLTWMFRSLRVGLVALLPNLFPLALLLGLLRLGGFDLKPSTAIVFAIAFGIVADDTIHFLSALSAGRARGTPPARNLDDAIREVGPALVLSTVVVCAGFGVLMASRFQSLFLIGLLTALAALLAVLADLFAFPSLYRILGPGARRPPPTPGSPS